MCTWEAPALATNKTQRKCQPCQQHLCQPWHSSYLLALANVKSILPFDLTNLNCSSKLVGKLGQPRRQLLCLPQQSVHLPAVANADQQYSMLFQFDVIDKIYVAKRGTTNCNLCPE